MFYTRLNEVIANQLRDGEFNFSMEKSEYVPLLSKLNSSSISRFFHTEMNSANLGEHASKFKLNPYYEGYRDAWNVSLQDATNSIQLMRSKFYEKIEQMDKLCYSIKKARLENIRSYNRPLKNISYLRLSGGKTQRVEGTTFLMPLRSIGFNRSGNSLENNRVYNIFYTVTFQTKYLEELKVALYKGLPFNNKWFTVFINPETPHITRNNKFTKPFLRDFITPFEEKGMNIEFSTSILEDISFSEVSRPYEYHIEAKNLTEQLVERQAALHNFVNKKEQQNTLQFNWNVGLQSHLIATAQLEEYKANSEFRNFDVFVSERYYTVPPIDGMNRKLIIREVIKSQVFQAGEWVDTDVILINVQREALEVVFVLHVSGSYKISRTYLETCDITVNSSFYGYSDVPYREDTFISRFDDFKVLTVQDYRVLETNLMYLEHSLPLTIKTIDSNIEYTLEPTIRFYAGYDGIAKVTWGNIVFDATINFYVLLSSDYVAHSPNIQERSFIYFADEDLLYYKKETLLFRVEYDVSVEEVIASLRVKNIEGDEISKSIFFNKINSDNALFGHKEHLWNTEFSQVNQDNAIPHNNLYDRDGNSITLGGTVSYGTSASELTISSGEGMINSLGSVGSSPTINEGDVRINDVTGDLEVYDENGNWSIRLTGQQLLEASIARNTENGTLLATPEEHQALIAEADREQDAREARREAEVEQEHRAVQDMDMTLEQDVNPEDDDFIEVAQEPTVAPPRPVISEPEAVEEPSDEPDGSIFDVEVANPEVAFDDLDGTEDQP